jgi:hypothetical protein
MPAPSSPTFPAIPPGIQLVISLSAEAGPHDRRCRFAPALLFRGFKRRHVIRRSQAERKTSHTLALWAGTGGRAADRYEAFLRRHQGLRILFLELGVGCNTPTIIKYPFHRLTAQNFRAVYACPNLGEAVAPVSIAKQSICIDTDLKKALAAI